MKPNTVIVIALSAVLARCGVIDARAAAGEAPVVSKTAPVGRPVDVVQFGHAMGPGFGINAVAWMPDGERAVTLGQDGKIIFWNAKKGWVVARPGAPVWAHGFSISPDGAFAVETGEPEPPEARARLIDLAIQHTTGDVPGRPRLWIGAQGSRLLLAVPDGCVGSQCALAVVDPAKVTKTAAPLTRLGERFGNGGLLAASADAERFAAVVTGPGLTQVLGVWSSGDLGELARVELGAAAVEEIGFDRDGRRVFARDAAGAMTIVDTSTGNRETRTLAASILAGTRVLMTDIDRHAVLLETPPDGGARAMTTLVDYLSGQRLAQAHGSLAALFLGRGAVVVEEGGEAVFLDVGSGTALPLGRGIARALQTQAPPGLGGSVGGSTGPALALSQDGRNLVSADGWWEPIGRPEQRVGLTGFQVLAVDRIWLSPDGRRFALLLPARDRPGLAAWVFDLDGGRLYRVYDGDAEGTAGWLSNNEFALVTDDGRTLGISAATGEVRALAARPPDLSYGERSQDEEPDLSCAPIPAEHSDAGAAQRGYSKVTCTYWELMGSGALSFTSTRDWKNLFVLYLHPDGTWLVQGGGRYDTNRPADASDLRWQMPDAPWGSLPAQTYMRDFYQPRLTEKLLDCNAANTCRTALKPLPDISTLDWVLPKVSIVGVTPVLGENSVWVDVKAVGGEDPSAPEGRRTSGVHDLRLFRDGKLVGQWPAPMAPPPGASAADLVRTWRGDTAVPGTEFGAATRRFVVALPTTQTGGKVTFSAYAFNRDRVKGETAAVDYVPPVPPRPRQRRAYVISIGINAYRAIPDHALRFAVNDAMAISRSMNRFLDLSNVANPGQPYEVVSTTLVSNGVADQATKDDIRAVLDLLAGKNADGARTILARSGVDSGSLAKANPDDLVVLAFSGHGWANRLGDFYLLPSDAQGPDPGRPDSLKTLISSAELTDWLRGLDAGEMAMIIDACHSAASVAAEGFRPGPMGDPGLGQLAFDKGIRILAATQADDVALESDALGDGHGMLTYVLANKAMDDPRAGGAPRDADGGIRIDVLLNYVVDRLPELAASLRAAPPWLADRTWTPMLAPRDPPPPEPPHLQQPALFDFTGTRSPVAVKPPAKVGS